MLTFHWKAPLQPKGFLKIVELVCCVCMMLSALIFILSLSLTHTHTHRDTFTLAHTTVGGHLGFFSGGWLHCY